MNWKNKLGLGILILVFGSTLLYLVILSIMISPLIASFVWGGCLLIIIGTLLLVNG